MLAAAFVLSASSIAAADPAQNAKAMGDMNDYYGGETRQAYLFVGVGVASIGGGAILATRSGDFARGLGWSLITMGALQGVGAMFYSFQVADLRDHMTDVLSRDPVAFKKEEGEHIHGTTSRFVVYRSAELALAVAGAGVATYGFVAKKDVWKGIGIGVAAESLTFFVLDSFGTQAADDYEDKVKAFEPSISLQVGGGEKPWGASMSGRF